jgi:hypothetical protein
MIKYNTHVYLISAKATPFEETDFQIFPRKILQVLNDTCYVYLLVWCSMTIVMLQLYHV